MPSGLKRYFGQRHAHFITCSCWRRLPLMGPTRRKDLFLTIFEQTRQSYRFVVLGYVVMPEHFHIMIGEPGRGTISTVMQVLKQRISRLARQRVRKHRAGQLELWKTPPPAESHFWQPRFYDFNVWSRKKYLEKLRYMHRNPVTRGLVERPEQWRWSSFRFFACGEEGPVHVDYDLHEPEPTPILRR
jgi:putative transposase